MAATVLTVVASHRLPGANAVANMSLQSFLGLRQTADIDIILDGADNRKMAEIKTEDGKKEKHYLYYDGETVSGKVRGVDSRKGVISKAFCLFVYR